MNKTLKNQSGFVSILIASILMVVMALITLGFTRVVQSEQRQAIDYQLSKQAFYAAESGINIAMSIPGFPGSAKQDDCAGTGGNVSSDGDITYTCVLINPTPSDLVFGNDSVTTNKSKVVPIKTDNDPGSIFFEWSDGSSNNFETNCGTIANLDFDRNAEDWNKISPLRLDLVGIPNGNFGRNDLINNQFNAIFYPCDNGSGLSQVNFNQAKDANDIGRIIPVDCQDNIGEYECIIEITNVPTGMREYYARFNAIYNEINVRITAEGTAGDRLLFANAQAVVDSTGRAVDVFKRLQARVPLYNTYVQPNASLQTLDDICKLYQVQEDEIIDGCN